LWRVRRAACGSVYPFSQHGKGAHVAVIQDFHQIGFFVRETKISFIHDERTAEAVEHVEKG